MDIQTLSPEFSVSAQIMPQDLARLKAAGFRSLICNRPDGEDANQPVFAQMQRAAQLAGLEAAYVPVVPGEVSGTDVDAFGAALADLPGPVLAYCRTGRRSAMLWSMLRDPEHETSAGQANQASVLQNP